MTKTLLAITTYNQSDYTKLCLDSISKLNIDLDVLVIDDFSSDNTIELCSQYNTKIIKKDKPMGLTDSWNIAYQKFKADNYDFLIIANNDILIPQGSIEELLSIYDKWPFSLVVPLSTHSGSGHCHQSQSINLFYQFDSSVNDPENYQKVQDAILKNKALQSERNNLHLLDPFRPKMFNGFFFMMNRNIINYEHEKDILFNPEFPITKNEDEFNWAKLIPNNDYAAVCKTSFIFHYKGISATKELRDNKTFLKHRLQNEN